MNALILAAGFGSRLRDAESCKPLAEIHGISLIEISVRQLVAAGATHIVVATGYQADLLEPQLVAISGKVGVPIISRRVPDFAKPNGHSILAASDALEGPFLLVMSDHILSSELLSTLTGAQLPEGGVVLATDRNVDCERVDPEDATWVQISGPDQIEKIGKHIAPYDAVDCGAFLATQGLIGAIEDAVAKGRAGSLSDGMQELADRGLAKSCDIGSAWWIDVDEPQSLEMAKAQVKDHLPHLYDGGRSENALTTVMAVAS